MLTLSLVTLFLQSEVSLPKLLAVSFQTSGYLRLVVSLVRSKGKVSATSCFKIISPHPDTTTLTAFAMFGAISLLGKDFTKLSGPKNYDDWYKQFKPIAHIEDVWRHYTGDTPVLYKPTIPEFTHAVAPIEAANNPTSTDQSAKNGIITQGSSKGTDVEHRRANYEFQIANYGWDLTEYLDNNRSVRHALNLLRVAVEPWVHKEIESDIQGDPHRAWVALAKANKEPDGVRLDRALQAIEKIKMNSPSEAREYISRFSEVYDDILDAGGKCSHSRLISTIIHGLPTQYNTFVKYWHIHKSLSTKTRSSMYKDFRTRLLRYAEDNKKCWR